MISGAGSDGKQIFINQEFPQANTEFHRTHHPLHDLKIEKKTPTLRIEKFIFEQTSGFAMSVPVWRV